jgi:hypothetical protein
VDVSRYNYNRREGTSDVLGEGVGEYGLIQIRRCDLE